MQIIYGEKKLNTDNNGNYNKNNYLKNPFFILDLTFALLCFIFISFTGIVNLKFIYTILIVLFIGWTFFLFNNNTLDLSRTIHACGHCYVILLLFITYYLDIY